MRFLYFISGSIMQISLRVFFRKISILNPIKKNHSRTIYVANHASSFLDPVMLGALNKPVVFYMVRADVFKPFLKKIFDSAHMLPIYRQHDGGNTKALNDAVFQECNKLLHTGKNLIVFAEGFTDDVFVRRLKPFKKGAVRIGFGALESCNWKYEIRMQAVGCNYTDPRKMRSEVLINNGFQLCLNDYKSAYLENPNKLISELTLLLEKEVRNVIIDVQDEGLTEFHEKCQEITRLGMSATCNDSNILLEKRFEFSKKLADQLNSKNQKLIDLKTDIDKFYVAIQDRKTDIQGVYLKNEKSAESLFRLLYLLLLSPFALLGWIHGLIPYIIVKRFVHKKMKRPVFWSSVKIMLGTLVFSLFNIPFIFIFPGLLLNNWFILFPYFLLGIPVFFTIAYCWKTKIEELVRKIQHKNCEDLEQKRILLKAKVISALS